MTDVTTHEPEVSSTLAASVVIPTYNRRESLARTLEGLSRQTLPHDRWEALIVSDGSTDGTDAFLREYAASSSFTVRPIMQDNAGPSRARNRGIREAQGEVVVFVDDDVEPAPEFLEQHLRHHAERAGCADCPPVAVIGPLLPDPARRAEEPVWVGWEHAMLKKQYDAFRTGAWESAGPHHFYSGNASVRRRDLLAVGGFDETFTRQEDVEMAVRLERECGIAFVFDAAARALHRPLRNWPSWLKVPYAYGQWDVVRARRGDVAWDLVRKGYATRSLPTRLLARIVLALPALGSPLRGLLRASADRAYRAGWDALAYGTLSMAYNVHYLEGAQSDLGRGAMRLVLQGGHP